MTTKKIILSVFVLAIMLLGLNKMTAQVAPGAPTTPINTVDDLDVGTITNNTLPVTTAANGVMFYNPATNGPTIELTASIADGDGNNFDSYVWYNITNASGTETENLIGGQTTQTYTPSSLARGYHKFRVYGVITDGTTCQSDEYEDIILFVLPTIDVEAEHTLNGSASLDYCEDNVPTGADTIELSIASLTADYTGNTNGYTHPVGSDFEFAYQWYYSDDGGVTKSPMGTGSTQTVNDATTGIPTTPGTYTFYVDLEYTIKAKGVRDYVTYQGEVESAGTTVEVNVIAVPGAPAITIGTVTD
ncbi:hypothetical protein [Mesonia sp. K7]|uniref:hypothetical protein n=1 Tax=Mesonia sp. K7 TaxID=2218606 RepID=UPI000DA7ED01|nr:hypothetical protein [Mesonia sp. K7]PZD77142.1 hypothetical protein DNG35_09870 [Mesonia sp. K7]